MDLISTQPIGVVEYGVRLRPRKADATGASSYEEGDLLVRSLVLEEHLDHPYELRLTLLGHPSSAHPDPVAYLEADVTLRWTRDGVDRFVHGVVANAEVAGPSDDEVWVRLIVVPAFKLLDRSLRARIFQGLSVVEIAQEIVGQELADYDREIDVSRLTLEHLPRDYCVQFRETDLAFLQRILAEEGIFIHFDHSDDEVEKIVLVDALSSFVSIGFEPLADGAADAAPTEVPVIHTRPELADEEGILTFDPWQEVTTARVEMRAWDWKSQSVSVLRGEATIDPALPGALGEHVDYGDRRVIEEDLGAGAHRDVTADLAERGLARRTPATRISSGTSLVTTFSAGHIFTLFEHPNSALEGEYLLKFVRHEADCPEVQRGEGGDGDGSNYLNTFQCVRADAPYAPPARPKPRIYGHQTALVVGPDGEEIHTDELGRIKVRMHWDRSDTADPDASCWLRVAQMWSGPGWGTWFLPRIGMEVLVTFIDGDPDRPLATGCVYNGQNATPYPLPDEKTKTTLKSNSSPGGDGFNELRFEDRAGSEEIFLHAQKDLNETVLNNHNTSVGGHQTNSVSGNAVITIQGNQRVIINGAVDTEAKSPDGIDFKGCKSSVDGQYLLDASDLVKVTAPNSITLECQGSSIVLEPGSISLIAGGKAKLILDANCDMTSNDGSNVKLDANALMKASGAAKVLLDGNALMTSAAGSKVLLDGNAAMSSSGDVILGGATVDASSKGGSAMKLDAGALLSGPTAKVVGKTTAEVSSPATTISGNATVTVTGGVINLN